MGVDWVPCRIEPGVSRDEIDRLVELEAEKYRALAGLWGCLQYAAPQSAKEEIVQDCRNTGTLASRLLFKNVSHRVTVIAAHEIFPIEWRIAAYRTIPPWHLPRQVEQWRNYRREVSEGGHRAYLFDLFIFLRSFALFEFFENSVSNRDIGVREATGSWAKRPEVLPACEMVRDFRRPEPLPPPVWDAGRDSEPSVEAHERLAAIRVDADRVNELARRWNIAIVRGSYRIPSFDPGPRFETWIETNLSDKWFTSFLDWVKPWVEGGYGLYRDCE